MSIHNPPRGGTPVGHITELGPVEAASVVYMRLWTEDAGMRDLMQIEFVHALGAEDGARAADALSQIAGLMATYGRRPLMRHSVGCKCLGADEACFANLIGSACDGAMEDAMLMATLMVRADYAPALASLAQTLGVALRQMSQVPLSPTPTLH
ncbi:hypothetical protein [Tropicibacter naphthalenivorans]|uniref:Uncharacterized protein n=1 Tax=Tropicibacter naphthalenivorans TaxID=441103 RepID=A0A0P1G0X2_9RHOB|nr:hypothetical protein [Tropicibacter naphthalenivorans]CUH75340.1 hypothetical protein TRN7648_00389 [Tropicibacter naphthalenivorans]SMC44991.1 hypothetical protein SAMN04488093_101490 [Tropicibacter naphthalenivorans]